VLREKGKKKTIAVWRKDTLRCLPVGGAGEGPHEKIAHRKRIHPTKGEKRRNGFWAGFGCRKRESIIVHRQRNRGLDKRLFGGIRLRMVISTKNGPCRSEQKMSIHYCFSEHRSSSGRRGEGELLGFIPRKNLRKKGDLSNDRLRGETKRRGKGRDVHRICY